MGDRDLETEKVFETRTPKVIAKDITDRRKLGKDDGWKGGYCRTGTG